MFGLVLDDLELPEPADFAHSDSILLSTPRDTNLSKMFVSLAIRQRQMLFTGCNSTAGMYPTSDETFVVYVQLAACTKVTHTRKAPTGRKAVSTPVSVSTTRQASTDVPTCKWIGDFFNPSVICVKEKVATTL